MVHNPALRPTGRRLIALAAVGLLALTGCGGGSGGGSGGGDKSKVTVTYQQFGGSHAQEQFLLNLEKTCVVRYLDVCEDLKL